MSHPVTCAAVWVVQLNYGRYPMLEPHHPVDGRILPTDMDEASANDGPDTWCENQAACHNHSHLAHPQPQCRLQVFFKTSHMGKACRSDAADCPVGSPARGAEAAEIDAALAAEDARMETRFATRYHGGKDLGCGAPPRVYGDPWSRETKAWDAMREERSHGTGEDSSWQGRKENAALEVSSKTGQERAIDYAGSAEARLRDLPPAIHYPPPTAPTPPPPPCRTRCTPLRRSPWSVPTQGDLSTPPHV